MYNPVEGKAMEYIELKRQRAPVPLAGVSFSGATSPSRRSPRTVAICGHHIK